MGRANGRVLALAAVLAVSLSPACGAGTAKDDADAAAETRMPGGGAAGSGGATGFDGGPAPTEAYVPPCAICVRAENCCKAAGLTDCDYAAACVAAPASERQQFYVALCRALLGGPHVEAGKSTDVCGS